MVWCVWCGVCVYVVWCGVCVWCTCVLTFVGGDQHEQGPVGGDGGRDGGHGEAGGGDATQKVIHLPVGQRVVQGL